MQSFRNAVTVFLAVAFVSMSCGGTSSTTTFPTGGANGANIAVTADNADAVLGEVIGELLAVGFGAAKPIATKPTQSGNINVTVPGDESGTAKLTGSYSLSGQTFTYNLTLTFTNFSDDGVQFHQGKLTSKYTVNGQSVVYTYKGTINTQGAYKATLVFDFGLNSSQQSTGTVKITSNGQTFTVNVANLD